MERYPIRITPKKRSVDVRELWRYRDLIFLLTRKGLVLQYKQTVLGPAWILLRPMISAGVYAVVFGGIGNISTGDGPQFLFYLCSAAFWGFFSELVTKNATVFSDNAPLFGKVYFPRLAVPVAYFFTALAQLMVQLVPVGILLMFSGFSGRNGWAWLLVPGAVCQLGILGLGVGLGISALTAKYRDLRILVGFGMQLWMYASPVVYPMAAAGALESVLWLNPVSAPLELCRYALLGYGTVDGYYGLSLILTVMVTALGVAAFCRAERTFVDTI